MRIPRAHVHVCPIRPGFSVVRYKNGTVIGEVLQWPDGVWAAYAGPIEAKNLSHPKSGEGRTRAEAVDVLLGADAHAPACLELRSGSTGNVVRDAADAESRAEQPDAWAWWDMVRPMFEEDHR